MIVRSKNFCLKLEEILKEDPPTKTYNETEKYVLALIRKWHQGKKHFSHKTSGSTGKPKTIQISRYHIHASARATMEYIDPHKSIKNSLLCLDPRHIGGAMVIYRALIFDQDLTIALPRSHPLDEIKNIETFDLVSLVPMQFYNLTQAEINRFKVVLIGGAPMPIINTSYDAIVYATFGMTETVSHFALRKLDDELFHTIGDNEVGRNQDGTLKIRGTITNHNWLHTNDLIDLISNHTFIWLGRKDFVINTGGVKVHPEDIERRLKERVSGEFMVGALPDKTLGQKVVLIVAHAPHPIDFSGLEKYSQPREVYFLQEIVKTETGKINRLATMKKLSI